MQTIISIVVVILQFLLGQLLGFGTAISMPLPEGWELVVIPIGNILGVFGVGSIAALLRGERRGRLYKIRLVGTIIGGVLGLILILITPATGLNQVFYPLVGALIGYYAFLTLLQYYYERK
jgi:hypothetical protein